MDITNINDLGNIITEKINSGFNLTDLKNYLLSYNGTDWIKHIKMSPEKYTRNLLFSNDKIDILLICWNGKQSSGIHDHPDYGCLLRILQGELTEYTYVKNNDKIELARTSTLTQNQTSYKQGKIALHNIKNETDNSTYSLHIYSPPNYKPAFY